MLNRSAPPPTPGQQKVAGMLGHPTVPVHDEPPPQPPAQHVVAGGGGDFAPKPPPYHPQVPAHDLPPLRDARQSARRPYQGVIGPGRSTITPAQQISLAHQTGMDKQPVVQRRIAAYLKNIPSQPEFVHEAAQAHEAGVLPTSAIARILQASHNDPGVLQSFPNTGRTDVDPAIQQAYIGMAHQRGVEVPPNATTADVFKAAFGPKPSHPHGLLGGILAGAESLPRDIALTPLYTAQAGYALGAESNRVGAGKLLTDFAGQQVNFFKGLGSAQQWEQHPWQNFLGAASVGHLAGGVAGKLAGTELAPRQFAATRFETEAGAPTIDRGTYSKNLYERGGQKLRDLVTQKAPALQFGKRSVDLQASALKTQARSASQTIGNQASRERAAIAEPVQQAFSDLGRKRGKQAEAILRTHAMGLPGEELTPKQQTYLDAARTAESQSAGILRQLNVLGAYSKFRRDYHPLATTLAERGDPEAQAFLEADAKLEQAHRDKADTAGAQDAAKKALADFAIKHDVGGGAMPFRVPLESTTPLRDRLPGARKGVGAQTSRTQHYTGARFASGDFNVSHQGFLQGVMEPGRIEQVYRTYNHISDPKNGITVRAVPGQEIPENMVLQEVHPGEPHGHVQDEAVKPLQSLRSTLDDQATHVPDNGKEYRLWPRPVANLMMDRISEAGGKLQGVRTGNKILRNVQLYSRWAYPITNTLDNATRAAIMEGTGPLSGIRGRKGSGYEVPPEVAGHGVAATNLDKATLGPISKLYTEPIRKASIAGEDWTRRSLYLKNAVPAARRFGDPKQVLARWAKHDFASEAERLAARDAIDRMNRVLGDFGAMSRHVAVDFAFPYNTWPRFVAKNMTTTLPLYYPGRTLGVYRLGAYGQQAQNQLGTLSPSLQGIVPVGGPDQKKLVAQTSYPLAYGTLGSMLMPSYHGMLRPAGALSYASPFITQPLMGLTGLDPATGRILLNERGEGILASDSTHAASTTPLRDWLRLVASQTASQLPLLRAVGGQNPNAPDTSIPLPLVPGAQQTLPQRASGPSRFQTPLWMALLNTAQPFRLRYLDLPGEAQHGDVIYGQKLVAQTRAEAKAKAAAMVRSEAAREHVDPSKPSAKLYAIQARVAAEMARNP